MNRDACDAVRKCLADYNKRHTEEQEQEEEPKGHDANSTKHPKTKHNNNNSSSNVAAPTLYCSYPYFILFHIEMLFIFYAYKSF